MDVGKVAAAGLIGGGFVAMGLDAIGAFFTSVKGSGALPWVLMGIFAILYVFQESVITRIMVALTLVGIVVGIVLRLFT